MWKAKYLIYAMTAGLLSAEIVDRIAVTVANQVITESELMHEIRITAFLNGQKPDFSADSKRETARRLVEQKLVKKEMDLGRYPLSEPAEAEQMVANLKKTRGPDFARELAEDGVTEADLREHFAWALTLSNFIDLRFRPAIQVTNQDVQRYFAETIQPKDQNAKLDDMREQIRETLRAQRADQQMAEWLKETLSHTRVEYKDEALR